MTFFLFQSTLPVRGATAGERELAALFRISIHAPRAGSDSLTFEGTPERIEFQSTLPVRGATRSTADGMGAFEISIHAPRAGSDVPLRGGLMGREDFNPRSPCGERRFFLIVRVTLSYFNPRSPCGERLF